MLEAFKKTAAGSALLNWLINYKIKKREARRLTDVEVKQLRQQFGADTKGFDRYMHDNCGCRVIIDPNFVRVIKKLKAAGPLVLALATEEVAHAIVDYAADKTVPRRFGILAGSGYVERPSLGVNGVVVRLGFGGAAAPYAYAINYNPRAGKTGGVSPTGRRYKRWAKVGGERYLERALAHFAARVPRLVGAIIKREWGAVLG